MNSLDTNVVIRYLLNDIPTRTEEAKKVIARSACYITDVVAVEIIFVLEEVIGLERRDITTLVKAFLGLPNMVYNHYFLDQAIDLYKTKQTLSIVDCYAATEAKVYGNHLLSFDKELIKHGGRHVQEA